MPETVELTVETFHEGDAHAIAEMTDWLEREGILVKVLCAVCLKAGHPAPFVELHRDASGTVSLECPHRRLLYDGPDFGPPS